MEWYYCIRFMARYQLVLNTDRAMEWYYWIRFMAQSVPSLSVTTPESCILKYTKTWSILLTYSPETSYKVGKDLSNIRAIAAGQADGSSGFPPPPARHSHAVHPPPTSLAAPMARAPPSAAPRHFNTKKRLPSQHRNRAAAKHGISPFGHQEI